MDPKPFLEHAEWLERLAPALVFDSNHVDDVVQETWLTLIERPPRHATSPQGWLRSVLRNAARHSARSRRRRTAHEGTAAAQPRSSVPTPDEALDRALTRRRVHDAVLGLTPMHREVILLHYFEDVPAEAIARQLGVPAATVRTRLHRAREALRQELDREFGDRRAWGLALVPWGRRGQVRAATSVIGWWGAWFVSKKVLIPAVSFLLLLGFFLWGPSPWQDDPRHDSTSTAVVSVNDVEEGTRSAPVGHREPSSESSDDGHPSDGNSGRDPLETPTVADSPRDATEPGSDNPPWTGHVIDTEGQRVGGIGIGWFPSEHLFRLHRDQRLPVPFTEDELLTALARDLEVTALSERVRDQIWNDALPDEFDSVEELQPVFTRTGRRGEFMLQPPSASGDVFVTDHGWFVLGSERVGSRDSTSHEVRLLVAGSRAIAGQVVDPDGNPIGHASIWIGARRESIATLQPDEFGPRGVRGISLESDPDGRFETRAPDLREVGILVRSEHHEPKYLSWSGSSDEPLVVVLTPKPENVLGGTIEGVVVDIEGTPVPNAQIFVGAESTTSDEHGSFRLRFAASLTGSPIIAVLPGRGAAIGTVERPTPKPVELVLTPGRTLRGRITPFAFTDTLTDYRVSLFDATLFEDGWVEEVSADVPLPLEVAADGSFELRGLLDRPYRLRVWHQPTYRGVITEPIAASDQDVAIQLDRSDLWPTVRGRLVLPDGTPLASASVSLRWFTAQYSFGDNAESRRVSVTDSAGAFELHDVPRDNALLVLDHPAMKPIEWKLAEYDGAEVVFTAPVLLRFTVDEADSARFDSIRVLDSSLQSIPFTSYTAVSVHYGHVVELNGGASGVCEVTPAAHFLALYFDGDEVRRIPLHLTPGQVTRIVP